MENTESADKNLTGNLLVAQSGGPTPVINASLAGVISAALQFEDEIGEISISPPNPSRRCGC